MCSQPTKCGFGWICILNFLTLRDVDMRVKYAFSCQFYLGSASVVLFAIKFWEAFSWSNYCKTFSIVQNRQRSQSSFNRPFTKLMLVLLDPQEELLFRSPGKLTDCKIVFVLVDKETDGGVTAICSTVLASIRATLVCFPFSAISIDLNSLDQWWKSINLRGEVSANTRFFKKKDVQNQETRFVPNSTTNLVFKWRDNPFGQEKKFPSQFNLSFNKNPDLSLQQSAKVSNENLLTSERHLCSDDWPLTFSTIDRPALHTKRLPS